MKLIKNLTACLLVLALMLCVCACGQNTDSDPSTEATKPTTTEPSVTEPSETDPSVTEPSVTEPSETEPSETEPSVTEPVIPQDYLYSITVRTADGEPLSGVFVQLCRGESCCAMGTTGENGTAYYTEDLVGEGSLTAKIIVVPEGYQVVDGAQQISLADGEKDVVFVMEKIAAVEYLYAISVKDTLGNPFEGVYVQLCRGDSCCAMGTTGADGTAYYLEDLVGEGSLTAKIIVCPEGYQCVGGVQQIELADGVNFVEFVLETIEG